LEFSLKDGMQVDLKSNALIVFQEFKKENPQKFDNLPVHFGQLEFRESLAKSLLGLDSGVKHSDFKCTCIPSYRDKYWLDLFTPNIPSL
jgi:hypothetical protein